VLSVPHIFVPLNFLCRRFFSNQFVYTQAYNQVVTFQVGWVVKVALCSFLFFSIIASLLHYELDPKRHSSSEVGDLVPFGFKNKETLFPLIGHHLRKLL
jgi:hypothetical protein